MTHKFMRTAASYFLFWTGAIIFAVAVCVGVVFALAAFLEWAAHLFGG